MSGLPSMLGSKLWLWVGLPLSSHTAIESGVPLIILWDGLLFMTTDLQAELKEHKTLPRIGSHFQLQHTASSP